MAIARVTPLSNLVKSVAFGFVWSRAINRILNEAAKWDSEARRAADNGHTTLAAARLARSSAARDLVDVLKSLPSELLKEEKEPSNVRPEQPAVDFDFGL